MTAPGAEEPRESVGFRRRREKRERATAFLAGKPLLVGLDLAKKRHAVWLAANDLTPIERFLVDHSREGLARLLEEAERAREAGGLDRPIVFMEPTSHFWENVADFLEARGVPYRLISGLAVDRSREIEHITFAKGDFRDAELITKLGASGQWLERTLDRDPVYIGLRTLAREHEALIDAESETRLRVRSLLELALPEFLDAFDDPLGKTARSVLRKLARPEAAVPHRFDALQERLASLDGDALSRRKTRSLVARLECAPSFGVERLLGPTIDRLRFSVERFELYAGQRTEVRARLLALYDRTPYRRVLDTIPGVHPETHAVLLGLIGDPARFDRPSCVVKLAGIEPRENHSGAKEGAHSISRRGRADLRNVVYRTVLGFAKGNAQFARFIHHLRHRPRNPLTWFQAAMAAGNKYLRLVHRLCVTGKPYDPSKLIPRTIDLPAEPSPTVPGVHPAIEPGPRSSNSSYSGSRPNADFDR